MHVQCQLIDPDVLVQAEAPGDDVPGRMIGGFLGRDLAVVDHLLHERVVVGELLKRAFSKQVRTRVADVDDACVLFPGLQDRHRRPHVFLRADLDVTVMVGDDGPHNGQPETGPGN